MLRRQVPYYWTAYKRTWRGSVITSFLQPWLYVASMGVLLGRYVEADPAELGGASSYLDFVAPGLLAATAVQVAVNEVLWPVLGALKWDKTYFGMIATPLRVVDIVAGHLGFTVARVLVCSVVFAGVLALSGVYESVLGLLGGVLGAVLVGAAVAAPVYAYSAGAEDDQGFALVLRFGVIPMFLFSGAFFPVSNLPAGLEWVARVTPLWHGVELCRQSALGTWGLLSLVHLTYLVGLAAVGLWWAVRRLDRRLVA
jgi:lipooligosaccharide transport system permease protein